MHHSVDKLKISLLIASVFIGIVPHQSVAVPTPYLTGFYSVN